MKLAILGIIALIAFSTVTYAESCFNNLNELTDQMLNNQTELYARGQARNDYCEVSISKTQGESIEFIVRSENYINEFTLTSDQQLSEKDCKVSSRKLEAKAEYNVEDENFRLELEKLKDSSIQIELVHRPASLKNSIGQTKRAICKFKL